MAYPGGFAHDADLKIDRAFSEMQELRIEVEKLQKDMQEIKETVKRLVSSDKIDLTK